MVVEIKVKKPPPGYELKACINCGGSVQPGVRPFSNTYRESYLCSECGRLFTYTGEVCNACARKGIFHFLFSVVVDYQKWGIKFVKEKGSEA